jgi:hypothetical protein
MTELKEQKLKPCQCGSDSVEANAIEWGDVLQRALRFADNTTYPVYIKNALAEFGEVPAKYRNPFFG